MIEIKDHILEAIDDLETALEAMHDPCTGWRKEEIPPHIYNRAFSALLLLRDTINDIQNTK